MKIFQYIVIAVVTVAVIAGFFIAGSPQEERLRRFDQQRVWDLQMIQGRLVNYWQSKGALPEDLIMLNDNLVGFHVPQDPDTGNAYEYIQKDTLSFELCAVFARPSLGTSTEQPAVPSLAVPAPRGGIADSWNHSQGRACFERTIDPDFFKPNLDAVKPVPAR